MNQKQNNPETLLSLLLAKGGRPQKMRNLQSIYEICRLQYEAGSRDISVSSIGKLCERDGILKARGLYNAALADYRELIECWSRFAGPPTPKKKDGLASDDYISRIEDPAIRIMVNKIVGERNKLKAQINLLKSQTTVVIDRRSIANGANSTANFDFTDSEKKSLEKAISKDFLSAQGWREVDYGEIINSRGRTIFDPGFATAIRKLFKK